MVDGSTRVVLILTPDGAINTNTNTFLLASPLRVHTANKKWRSQNTQGWNTASNILNPWHWSLNCGSDPEQCQSIKFSGCEAAADMEATIDNVHKICVALSVAAGVLIWYFWSSRVGNSKDFYRSIANGHILSVIKHRLHVWAADNNAALPLFCVRTLLTRNIAS